MIKIIAHSMWTFLVVLLLLLWFLSVKEGIDEAVDGYEDGRTLLEMNSRLEVSQTLINEPKINIIQQLTDKQYDQMTNIKSMMATIKAQQAANKPNTTVPA